MPLKENIAKVTIFTLFFIGVFMDIVVCEKINGVWLNHKNKPVILSSSVWTYTQHTVHFVRNSLQKFLNLSCIFISLIIIKVRFRVPGSITQLREYMRWTQFSPSLWGRRARHFIGSPMSFPSPSQIYYNLSGPQKQCIFKKLFDHTIGTLYRGCVGRRWGRTR